SGWSGGARAPPAQCPPRPIPSATDTTAEAFDPREATGYLPTPRARGCAPASDRLRACAQSITDFLRGIPGSDASVASTGRPGPVVGVFEIEGGKIKTWRDYFDM